MRIWQFYGRCDEGVRHHALKHVTSARSSHVPGKMRIAGFEPWRPLGSRLRGNDRYRVDIPRITLLRALRTELMFGEPFGQRPHHVLDARERASNPQDEGGASRSSAISRWHSDFHISAASSAFASFRSGVSKPSVNQP